MRRHILSTGALASTLLLTGCFGIFGSNSTSGTTSSSSSFSSEEALPVVSLQGFVKVTSGPVPTVELMTSIGDIYTLTSSTIALSEFDGKEVQMTGALQRDPVSGNQILDVQEASLILSDQSSSIMSSEMSSWSSFSSFSSAEEMSSLSSISSSSSSKALTPVKSSSSSLAVVASSSSQAAAVSSSAVSADVAARIAKMARARGRESWTQQYCSAHIGVCFPVRSDYWYQSYAAQAGTQWHVELNSEKFADDAPLGTGPIAIDLVSGRLPDGVQDQQIIEGAGQLKAYRLWTGNRHFEVTAPAELRASVQVIIESLSPFETPTPQ